MVDVEVKKVTYDDMYELRILTDKFEDHGKLHKISLSMSEIKKIANELESTIVDHD